MGKLLQYIADISETLGSLGVGVLEFLGLEVLEVLGLEVPESAKEYWEAEKAKQGGVQRSADDRWEEQKAKLGEEWQVRHMGFRTSSDTHLSNAMPWLPHITRASASYTCSLQNARHTVTRTVPTFLLALWQILFMCPKNGHPKETPVKGFGIMCINDGTTKISPLPLMKPADGEDSDGDSDEDEDDEEEEEVENEDEEEDVLYGKIEGYGFDESVQGLNLATPFASKLMRFAYEKGVRHSPVLRL